MGHQNKILVIIVLIFNISYTSMGQSMLDELNQDQMLNKDTIYTEATFKAPRLINGQSVETVGKGGLNFIISHRFGNVDSDFKGFYGLDESHIRLGLEYGITKFMDIGLGRSREQKLYDGYVKCKLLRQSTGARKMPISISWYSALAIRGDDGQVPGRDYTFVNRMNYVHEILIARKFNDRFSLQIMPGIVHRNLAENNESPNIVPYTGIGGRVKITQRISISTEYYHAWNQYIQDNYVDPFSIGFDLETGGHVFQLHFSNSRAMQEKIMIPENQNKWSNGGFGFGFNIIRHFYLK